MKYYKSGMIGHRELFAWEEKNTFKRSIQRQFYPNN